MLTSRAYPLAELGGYKKKIEDAGGILFLSGACPGMVRGKVMPGMRSECSDLDAAKQDYYLTDIVILSIQ
jgi:hypothetical protein